MKPYNLNAKGEGNRFRDALYNTDARDYVERMTRKTGEYIDQFTYVPDLRTTDEIMNRKPKACYMEDKDEKSRPDNTDRTDDRA